MSLFKSKGDLQIWNHSHSKKWISNTAESNSEIAVRKSAQKQPWKVKLEPGKVEHLWNIFIQRDEIKLFASYESDDDRVTLQTEGQRQTLFLLGVAIDGLFLIKTNEKSKNRFLKQDGEIVKVVQVPNEMTLDQTFSWDIAEVDMTEQDLVPRSKISRDVTITLAKALGRPQWSHSGLLLGDQIPVKTFQESNQQYWRMEAMINHKGEAVLNFSTAENESPNRSVVSWENDQVMLSEKNVNQPGRNLFKGMMRSNGFVLKTDNPTERKFIGVANDMLTLEMQSRAKIWFPEPETFA